MTNFKKLQNRLKGLRIQIPACDTVEMLKFVERACSWKDFAFQKKGFASSKILVTVWTVDVTIPALSTQV